MEAAPDARAAFGKPHRFPERHRPAGGQLEEYRAMRASDHDDEAPPGTPAALSSGILLGAPRLVAIGY